MKLGTKGRYAVMAVVDLAMLQQGDGTPVSLSEIAERQEVSLSYLEQIFLKLRRQHILKSARGAMGGYLLARPAAEISIADVVLAVDEPIHVTRCVPLSQRGCRSNGERCVVHHLWADLGDVIHDFLKGVTLQDLCDKAYERQKERQKVFHE